MSRGSTWNTVVIGGITAAGLGVLLAGSLAEHTADDETRCLDANIRAGGKRY
jgi:hypothetical protein